MAKKKAKKAAKKSAKKSKKAAKKKPAKKAKKKVAKKTKKPAKQAKKKSPAAKKAAPKAAKAAIQSTAPSPVSPATTPIDTASPEATSPEMGTDVPAETLDDVQGQSVNLKALANKSRHFVLYFYPKDDTPGCTKQACDFRDHLSSLTEHGATVVGVSPDAKESHKNFVSKYDLNFNLLSDSEHKLSEKMGVWKQKNFMGNSYMGVERSTFLFTDGKLARVWQPVKVEGHVAEVLNSIQGS